MPSPEERVPKPGAWIMRGRYKLAHWPLAEGGHCWEVSYADRVIARCEKYSDALAAVAAHQANGVL